jgi:hypothetical protein
MTPRKRPEPLDREQFRALPEPVHLEDTVTSEDSLVVAPERDDEWREVQWLLRTTGL